MLCPWCTQRMSCKSSYTVIYPQRSLQGKPYDPGQRIRVYICKNPKCAKRDTMRVRTIELTEDDLMRERTARSQHIKALEHDLFALKIKMRSYTAGRVKITVDQLQHLLAQFLEEMI